VGRAEERGGDERRCLAPTAPIDAVVRTSLLRASRIRRPPTGGGGPPRVVRAAVAKWVRAGSAAMDMGCRTPNLGRCRKSRGNWWWRTNPPSRTPHPWCSH
jgi:hypothetical protein